MNGSLWSAITSVKEAARAPSGLWFSKEPWAGLRPKKYLREACALSCDCQLFLKISQN
jgi:hypothetical protein